MQVLKIAMHATVEMLITSLSQLILENVTSHALEIKVNSVAARGVCKYMIPNIQKVCISVSKPRSLVMYRRSRIKSSETRP